MSGRKTVGFLLLLLAASCATRRPPEPEPSFAPAVSESDRALSWLVCQQRPDGFWGTDPRRVRLTSLAALAFLSRGETPASSEYGKPVEQALCALLREADAGVALSIEDHALLAWCLAKAYGVTQVPMLREAARKYATPSALRHPTPWHALASHSLLFSGADPEGGRRALTRLLKSHPSDTDDLLNRATLLFLLMRTGAWRQSAPCLETIRRLAPARWRQSDKPLQTALMLSTAFFDVGGQDWARWDRTFCPEVARQQLVRGTLGWWTPRSLGVSDTVEALGLSEDEGAVYATSIVLLALARPRVLPLYRAAEDAGTRSSHDERNVRIDIQM
jgi:hypothetical protein